MPSLKTIWGAAAYGCAAASWTETLRSGTWRSGRNGRTLLQAAEEPVDLLPQLGSAGQPAPAGPDQPGQPVALVDGHDVALARRPALHAVDEQRLDVGFERA